MIPQWLIEKKRDGGVLSDEEIRSLIAGYTVGEIPDYQMAAFAMAVYFQGMTVDETATLTDAMMRSGDCVTFPDWPRPTADKHSTGGIGDKLSLMIAPLAVSLGLAVPMISGRGLGITGGTLDKLESIPGYDTRLTVPRFQSVVRTVGCSIIGQTATLAPADKKLYALRDVTGTVPSIPLITASIMSKKLAEGADTLVFDVKCGRAAFMHTVEDARALAESLLHVGHALGRRVAALITNMDQPLGRAIGNAVEVAEAVETLRGKGPADTRELTLAFTALMLETAGLFKTRDAARAACITNLDNGAALDVFRRMVEAQGGDVAFIDDPTRLPQPAAVCDVLALADGWVVDVDACELGKIVLELGGGRVKTSDTIDPAAGITRLVQAGEHVACGAVLMQLTGASAEQLASFVARAQGAVTLASTAPATPRKLVLEEI